jgi:RsiW-degrading membrane proteinase PrsW (M82 family)
MIHNFTSYFIGVLWVGQVLFILQYVSVKIAQNILRFTMIGLIAILAILQIFQGSMTGFAYEIAVLVLEAALVYLSYKDFRWLALAFFLHGTWDLMHVSQTVSIEKPLVVSQLCVPYDWIVAVYILVKLSAKNVKK